MFRPAVAIALVAALAATPVVAQSGKAPQRIRNVQLTGNEKCPEAQGDEIVVCSKISPQEQYRIPKELRNGENIAPANQAWTNRVAVADQVGREAGGLPDTCSPVGTGGQSGCALKMNKAYAAEKRAAEKNDSMTPGGGNP
jgi:hypothetical protein